MKSLHFITVFLFWGILSSCSKLNDKEVMFLLRTKNLMEHSTEVINHQSDFELEDFYRKTIDPQTSAKSLLFFPNAKLSALQIDSFSATVKELKMRLTQSAGYPIEKQSQEFDMHFFKEKHLESVEQTANKEAFQKINTFYCQLLKKLKNNYTSGFDSTNKTFYSYLKTDGEALIDKYTINVVLPSVSSLLEAVTELAIIENNIATLKGDYISHCEQNIAGGCNLYYESFEAILTSNKSVFIANEKIEIYAGIGRFVENAKPVYKINNKIVASIDGLATYQTKVSSSIGEHRIPIEITYFKPDGTRTTKKHDIIYHVVDTICSY